MPKTCAPESGLSMYLKAMMCMLCTLFVHFGSKNGIFRWVSDEIPQIFSLAPSALACIVPHRFMRHVRSTILRVFWKHCLPWAHLRENVLRKVTMCCAFRTSVPEILVYLLLAWDKRTATTSKHQVKCILIHSSKQIYLLKRCGKVQMQRTRLHSHVWQFDICRSSVLKCSQTCKNRLWLEKESNI